MAAIFRISVLVLRISIAELCAKKLRNTKLRNHFNPTRHTFIFNQGEVYIKMAGVMDATVSPSQALFMPKIRNARLISGNETLVTAISNSNVIPILGMNKCLFLFRVSKPDSNPRTSERRWNALTIVPVNSVKCWTCVGMRSSFFKGTGGLLACSTQVVKWEVELLKWEVGLVKWEVGLGKSKFSTFSKCSKWHFKSCWKVFSCLAG